MDLLNWADDRLCSNDSDLAERGFGRLRRDETTGALRPNLLVRLGSPRAHDRIHRSVRFIDVTRHVAYEA